MNGYLVKQLIVFALYLVMRDGHMNFGAVREVSYVHK